MISEIDIWRGAKLLINQKGDDAPSHAAMMADRMVERNDLVGKAVGRRLPRGRLEDGGHPLQLAAGWQRPHGAARRHKGRAEDPARVQVRFVARDRQQRVADPVTRCFFR